MNDVIFREYDIRGIVGEELFIENVYALAGAIASYFHDRSCNMQNIVIGMDVRTHSQEIKNELCRGLVDAGYGLIFIGVCHSPMLYYAIKLLNADAGIMITASHNPKEYNGFKIYVGTDMVHGEELQKIKSHYHAKQFPVAFVAGKLKLFDDITSSYIDMLHKEFSHLVGIDMSMVFDCANGSAAVVVPALIERMQWSKATILHAQPDGMFPNHPADPIIDEHMQDVRTAMRMTNALVGIGFDGDADRMGAVADNGVLVSGDKLLALFAQYIKKQLGVCRVVYDINASTGLATLFDQWNIHAVMSPCGHAHIKQYMHQYDALVGGEISCHFMFKDRAYSCDDGIYAAMRLIEILQTNSTALMDILTMFPASVSSPRYRLTCAELDKKMLVQTVYEYCKQKSDINMLTIDGVRIETPHGWGLVRASNTQAQLCFTFEATTIDEMHSIQRIVADALAPVYTPNLYTIFGL